MFNQSNPVDTAVVALVTRLDAITQEAEAIARALTAISESREVPALDIELTDTPKSQRKSRKAPAKSNTDNVVAMPSTRRDQIEALLAEGKSPKVIAESLGTHIGYVYTVKRATYEAGRPTTAPKTRKVSTAKPVTAVTQKGDRKAQILALLKKGQSPAVIAEALGTHVNYVYTVRRSAA